MACIPGYNFIGWNTHRFWSCFLLREQFEKKYLQKWNCFWIPFWWCRNSRSSESLLIIDRPWQIFGADCAVFTRRSWCYACRVLVRVFLMLIISNWHVFELPPIWLDVIYFSWCCIEGGNWNSGTVRLILAYRHLKPILYASYWYIQEV